MKKRLIYSNMISNSFLVCILCIFLFQTVNAQKGDLVLNFSGKDAVTSNIVPLESVKVSNETQEGDTTLYGAAPTLSLQWASGIFEQNHGQQASFVLEPNYPNPFAENTTVNIQLRKPQYLIITLYDQQGAVAENMEQDFGFGTHRFEISVPQNRLCLLTVNDGATAKTLKMFSTTGKDYRIKYIGTDENAGYKSEAETATFVFQPGDVLKYTVNATGYYEYTTYDNPAQSTDYVFTLQPNTSELPPTVTTAAITNITATTATCGGTVTSEGSAAVTARGVCWSTSQNPTIANSFTVDGSGLGSFTSAIAGLTESTTYYVRAYTTNQFGTAYGNEVSFTTAALVPVYVCDSVITYSNQNGIGKTIYTRDATGKLLKVVDKYLNTTYGVWVNIFQSLHTYNAQGKQISRLDQDWETNTGSWVNSSQNLYTYDAQGNRTSYVNQYWIIEIGCWVNDWQYLYTYDASGNMLIIKEQNWDTNIGSWVNSWQDLLNYDASGNMLSEMSQYWNTEIGSWVNESQYLYSYDAIGNITSYSHQNWGTEIGNWLNDFKLFYTYDATGNMLSGLSQYWNVEIGNWVNDSQYLHTYDAQGNQLSILGQDWNTEIGSWVNNWQNLYTYDAQGNQFSYITQDWNTEIGSWVNYCQYIFNYDTEGNILLKLYQVWSISYGTWVNVNKLEYQYDYTTRKITAMYYEWSGAWQLVDCYFYLQVYLFNNSLFTLPIGYKVEVWYNSYQALTTNNALQFPDESFYQNHSNQEEFYVSKGNPSRKYASSRTNPKTKIHEKEAWMDNGLTKSPANKQFQRNLPVQPVTRKIFYSK